MTSLIGNMGFLCFMHSKTLIAIIHDQFIKQRRAHFGCLVKYMTLRNHARHFRIMSYIKQSYSSYLVCQYYAAQVLNASND